MATSHERLRLKGVRCLKLPSFRSSRRKLPLPQKLCQGAVPASFLITEIAGHLPFLRLVARLSCKAGEIVLTFSILKQASFSVPLQSVDQIFNHRRCESNSPVKTGCVDYVGHRKRKQLKDQTH